MTLRKKLLKFGAACLATLYLASPSKAADVTVEAVATQDTATLDTKISGSLAPRFKYFCRNRTGVTYQNDAGNNQVGSFTVVDLISVLGKGFDFLGEMQLPSGMEMDPRLGIQYFKKFKNTSEYFLVTRDFKGNPNTEITNVIGLNLKLKGDWTLMGRWEEIVNLGDENYNFDLARLRLGAGYKKFAFGPAADISGIASGQKPNYQIGGFVQVKF